MWRSSTLRKGRQILTCAQRQLAAEAGGATPTPPPPQPKSGGFGVFKFLGVSLPLAAGGLVGYAWYDKDFRKQLEETVPYAKELLENVLPADDSAPQSNTPSKAMKPKIPDSMQVPAPLFETNASPKAESSVFAAAVVPTAACSTNEETLSKDSVPVEGDMETKSSVNNNLEESDSEGGDSGSDIEGGSTEEGIEMMNENQNNSQEGFEGVSSGLSVAKQDKESDTKKEVSLIEQQLQNKEAEEKADNAVLEVVIEKLLESGEKWVSEASKAQMDVATATKNHSTLLKKAMDDSSDILAKDADWEAVTIAFKEREIAMARSNELVEEARKSMGKLKQVLDEGKATKSTAKNPAIYPATKKLAEFNKEMTTASTQVRHADADAKVMLKYKDLVDKGKKQFKQELESLVPDVKVGGRSRKLTEEELNALIAHAHRRIEQLQKQIAEQMAMERKRLSVALDAQKVENRSLTEAAVADERAALIHEFALENDKQETQFKLQMELDIRKQLSRQAAAHSDHLKDVLAFQEGELNKDFDRKMNIKMLEEREKFQTETASWISRLKGIEAAVDARAASEKLARTAQDLWLACIALSSTIQFGNEDNNSMVPLKDQVEAVVNSANKHLFVETVANTIPQAALERGIYTESELRDRFVKVSQISRRVGLVTESNASLYKYLVSFLHSFFAVNHVAAYSETDSIQLDDLDNFKLVANAQYWMERGNLEIAVRFMSQLTGQSRIAADDWITEARLLLETRLAAHTIMTFASATGLAATF